LTITYRKVKAANPALSKKIETAISFERNMDFNLVQELPTDAQAFAEADFEVKYNKKGILSISLFMTGSSAYTSTSTKNIVADLKTGNQIKPARFLLMLMD
jgi:hypothetical protein